MSFLKKFAEEKKAQEEDENDIEGAVKLVSVFTTKLSSLFKESETLEKEMGRILGPKLRVDIIGGLVSRESDKLFSARQGYQNVIEKLHSIKV